MFEIMRRVKLFVRLVFLGESKLAMKSAIHFFKYQVRLLVRSFETSGDKKVGQVNLQTSKMQFLNGGVPLVSVVIPHVNYSHFLSTALDCASKSSLKNIEIIVIESGSDEIHAKKVKEIESSQIDPRIRFFYTKRKPLGENRNFGIGQSAAQIICSYDPDDRMYPYYLELSLFNLVADDLDVSGTYVLLSGEENKIWKGPKNVTKRDLEIRNEISSSSLFTKEIWASVGKFKDSNPMEPFIHEDWKFWHKVASLGGRIGILPAVYFNVFIHGNNMSRRAGLLPDHEQIRRIKIENSLQERKLAKVSSMNSAFAAEPIGVAIRKLADLTEIKLEHKISIMIFMPWWDESGAPKVVAKVAEYLSKNEYNLILILTHKRPEHANGNPDFPGEVFDLGELFHMDLWLNFVEYLIISRRVHTIWNIGSDWFFTNISKSHTFPKKIIQSLFVPDNLHMFSQIREQHLFTDVIFESEAMRSNYFKNGGTTRNHVIPNGVEISDFVTPIKNRQIELIYASRLAPEKDPHSCISILEGIPEFKVGGKWNSTIIGGGPLLDSIKDLSRRKGLSTEVIGHVSDPITFISDSKILVLTSTHFEGRPNVVLEAMSRGTVVIAFNVGAISEMIQDGVDGFVIEEGKITEFRRKVLLLLNSEELLSKMSLNALARSREWEWSVLLPSYLPIFDVGI